MKNEDAEVVKTSETNVKILSCDDFPGFTCSRVFRFSLTDRGVTCIKLILYNFFLLLQACEIRHVNLNPYIGIFAEFPDVFMVSEYCAKGSLQVIIF